MKVPGRSSWTFAYCASDMRGAAQKQVAWHRGREALHAEQVTALEEAMGVAESHGQQDMDPEKGSALADARQRRDFHARSARMFEAYVGAFSMMGESRLYLTIEDVDYFALHRESGT